MFGYVIANTEIMTDEQKARYKACYCGLCRALRLRRGGLSRVTLTYDMTFLILLLSSMYESEEQSGEERCFMHPMKSHGWWASEVTEYAADMNLYMGYLNQLDDWNDDKSAVGLAAAVLFGERCSQVREEYPAKCAFIEERLAELDAIEKADDPEPDDGARCFGQVMGELFSWGTDSVWGPRIREFGEALGRFVYIMDAVVDLKKDAEKGRYNPMARFAEGRTEDDLRYTLTMLIGECAACFERLPIVQDADIMRNVLYSGVWMRYNASMKKTGEEGEDADEQRPV